MSDRRLLLSPLLPLQYDSIVRNALLEDFGRAGDLTTDAIVTPEARAAGRLVSRSAGRIAGLDIALHAFRCLDPEVRTAIHISDGEDSGAGQALAILNGKARALLTAERTALNLLGRLSGIATATNGIVRSIAAWPAKVVCTRKTTPGLRSLEKYAVRAGGGFNHRFGLDDAVLIKDNHRAVAGGITEAVTRVRKQVGHMVKIEVEVDTIAELEEALSLRVDAVLLDNMTPAMLAEGVRLVNGRAVTEASGGVTPESAPLVAAAGVDLISVGWITHSAPALDVALDFDTCPS